MIPQSLQVCLKKVATVRFDQEPPYDYILNCLQGCFEQSIKATLPIYPRIIKVSSLVKDKEYKSPSTSSHVFEWNHTLANKVRNVLLEEKVDSFIAQVEEVKLITPLKSPLKLAANSSIKSRNLSEASFQSLVLQEKSMRCADLKSKHSDELRLDK